MAEEAAEPGRTRLASAVSTATRPMTAASRAARANTPLAWNIANQNTTPNRASPAHFHRTGSA